MRLRAVALLDAIAEESWLTWARRHNLMPETEAERVRAVQAEEERQRRAELRRQQEETRRAEAAARQRAALAAQEQATSSQTGRTSRQASGRRPRVESVGEDVDMLNDAGLATQGKGQGKGSAVKEVELKENPFLVRRYAIFVLSLLTFH
jgi:type IV secretory pathway VirB10-like protein